MAWLNTVLSSFCTSSICVSLLSVGHSLLWSEASSKALNSLLLPDPSCCSWHRYQDEAWVWAKHVCLCTRRSHQKLKCNVKHYNVYNEFIVGSNWYLPSCSVDLPRLFQGIELWCGSGHHCRTWPPRTACWSTPCAPVHSCRQTEWYLHQVSLRQRDKRFV